MHLPYVRKMFESRMQSPETDIKIIPLMVGQVPQENYPAYAKSLVEHFKNERTLFVTSSDFCHWGQRFQFTHKYAEFQEAEIHKSIEKLDKTGMGHIESHNVGNF